MALARVGGIDRVGFVLVLLMAALQGFYAVYAYLDPNAFSGVRGTDLIVGDEPWVQIYASRTLFIALLIGYFLYLKHYKILMMAALFGVVMPLTDGVLAYTAGADSAIIVKHVLTAIYLIVTFFVLRKIVGLKNHVE